MERERERLGVVVGEVMTFAAAARWRMLIGNWFSFTIQTRRQLFLVPVRLHNGDQKKNCQCGPEPHSFIVSSLIHPPKKKVRWKQVRTGIRLPFGESRGTLAIAGTPCQESKSLAFQLIQEAYEYLSDPELLGGEWHGTFRSWLSH